MWGIMKVVVINTKEQVEEYKRGEESAPFICPHYGYQAFIAVKYANAHEDACKGRKIKIRRKKTKLV